jgi:DNA modification methylase
MWQTIIEAYTQPGDTVLDPMAGIGTTAIAALMGRNVICVEMERHFLRTMTGYTCPGRTADMVDIEFRPYEPGQWKIDGAIYATYDEAVEHNADGKPTQLIPDEPQWIEPVIAHYETVKRPAECGKVHIHGEHWVEGSWEKMRRSPMSGYEMGTVTILQGDARDLGELLADAVITSPPFQDNLPNHTAGHHKTDFGKIKGIRRSREGYTRPDAIVTSPPYEAANQSANRTSVQPLETTTGTSRGRGFTSTGMVGGFVFQGDNIGNLRNSAYWEAMHSVYAECYRILKPGGILALVVKGFTRDGKYVDLPSQTSEMCESLGFTPHDHWARELWSLSFWRILQQRRDPQAFDDRLKFEEIIAFKKPDCGDGNVDAVITSPPYEGSIQGEPGIDWTKMDGGTRDMTKEDAQGTRVASLSGYTRPGSKPVCPWRRCECELEHVELAKDAY